MIRYFSVTVVTFACLVAFAVAQEQQPAPKKKADVQKNDPAEPDAKKDGANKEDPEDAKPKPREDPKKIIEQLREDFGSARKNLEKNDAGENTRDKQNKILEGIDKLLDQNDDDNKGGGGGGSSNQGGSSSNQGGGSSNQGGGSSNQGGGSSNQGGGQSKKNDPMVGDNKDKGQNGGKGDNKNGDKDQGKSDEQKKKDESLAKKDEGGGGNSDAKKDDKGGGKGFGGVEGKGGDATKDSNIAELKKDIWGHLPDHRRKEMDAFSRERFMPRYEEQLRAYYRAIAESARRKDGD